MALFAGGGGGGGGLRCGADNGIDGDATFEFEGYGSFPQDEGGAGIGMFLLCLAVQFTDYDSTTSHGSYDLRRKT